MIIPVFDVKKYACVSGKSGNRSSYTRLNSFYGNNILEIVHNLKDSGAKIVYIADLDKIEGNGDNSELISKINEILPVLLDNGASSMEDIMFNKNICTYSILATESMEDINSITAIIKKMPHENIVLSIDLLNDELLVKNKEICLDDITNLVNKAKVAYTIILNISQVGTRKGGTNSIVSEIIEKTPCTQHIIGGGLTNNSIRKYKDEGIDNFLVGTILHNGQLSSEFLW